MAIELKQSSKSLRLAPDGTVVSSEGWAVRQLRPDLLEYCQGRAACLVNVAYAPTLHVCQVYASESASELFPHLVEHLRRAAGLFKGHYIVI
jgi:hypothetical protein